MLRDVAYASLSRAERASQELAEADAHARMALQARDAAAGRLAEAERQVAELGGDRSVDPAHAAAIAAEAATEAERKARRQLELRP